MCEERFLSAKQKLSDVVHTEGSADLFPIEAILRESEDLKEAIVHSQVILVMLYSPEIVHDGPDVRLFQPMERGPRTCLRGNWPNRFCA